MIDLKEFISSTLHQIVEGIVEAQGAEKGDNINAVGSKAVKNSKHAYSAGSYGTFTLVDFDIAVTAESNKTGKASIKVWGVGAEGGGDVRNQAVSRVVFSIPVRMPDGDKERAKMIAQKAVDQREKINDALTKASAELHR